ncbi:MAG: peptide chain release factor N(5)-glutamine methyltransferase, partial [Candidatus Moraniibacteriota bacterium]
MRDLTIKKALSLVPHLPRLDREVLLSYALGKDRVFLMAHGETELTPIQTKRYQSSLARALRHEPIAYIIGKKEFYGRDFFVGPGVLIPRPETEILVEHALKNILLITQTKKNIAVIDVGTGSGAIITSIFLSLKSHQQKNISWFAVDNKRVALSYARKNAKQYAVNPPIRFIQSDLLSALEKKLSTYTQVFVIANLPYLSSSLYQLTAPTVRRHEPKSALVSGTDGLAHYRHLLKQLQTLDTARVQVSFLFEISPEQAKKLPSLCAG